MFKCLTGKQDQFQALVERLAKKNWDSDSDSVQSYWNEFENQLIEIVDELVPYAKHKNNSVDTTCNHRSDFGIDLAVMYL